MDEGGKSWIDWLLAGLLAVVSFAVYAATLSVGAYPGPFSHLMVQATGLFRGLRRTIRCGTGWRGWWFASAGRATGLAG